MADAVAHALSSGSDPVKLFGAEALGEEALLKRAYKRMALRLHPDKNSHPEAGRAFHVLQDTFEDTLTNLAKYRKKAAPPPQPTPAQPKPQPKPQRPAPEARPSKPPPPPPPPRGGHAPMDDGFDFPLPPDVFDFDIPPPGRGAAKKKPPPPPPPPGFKPRAAPPPPPSASWTHPQGTFSGDVPVHASQRPMPPPPPQREQPLPELSSEDEHPAAAAPEARRRAPARARGADPRDPLHWDFSEDSDGAEAEAQAQRRRAEERARAKAQERQAQKVAEERRGEARAAQSLAALFAQHGIAMSDDDDDGPAPPPKPKAAKLRPTSDRRECRATPRLRYLRCRGLGAVPTLPSEYRGLHGAGPGPGCRRVPWVWRRLHARAEGEQPCGRPVLLRRREEGRVLHVFLAGSSCRCAGSAPGLFVLTCVTLCTAPPPFNT